MESSVIQHEKHFFLKNQIQNAMEKLFPDPEKSKLSISLDQQPEILYSLFLLFVQVDTTKDIKTNVLTTCFNLI